MTCESSNENSYCRNEGKCWTISGTISFSERLCCMILESSAYVCVCWYVCVCVLAFVCLCV
jgi:hypothetical protein